jgi:hypothetical protein
MGLRLVAGYGAGLQIIGGFFVRPRGGILPLHDEVIAKLWEEIIVLSKKI